MTQSMRHALVNEIETCEAGFAPDSQILPTVKKEVDSTCLEVPLIVNAKTQARNEPVTIGVPFPKATIRNSSELALFDARGRVRQLQSEVLARWSDGSIKWLLLDFLTHGVAPGTETWKLRRATQSAQSTSRHIAEESAKKCIIDTGVARFHLDRFVLRPFQRIELNGRDVLDQSKCNLLLSDAKARSSSAPIDRFEVESAGPIRTTVRCEGRFAGSVPVRFIARLCFFVGTGLVRLRLTIHNPNPARHPGGIWDLGDQGSMFFRDLSLNLSLLNANDACAVWRAEPNQEIQSSQGSRLEIYQDSSGGENWQIRNHVNRDGKVPCSFRGYRVRTVDGEARGHRASPVVSVVTPGGCITAAVPEFWQQFPKALEIENGACVVRLFPGQFGDQFEIQGGEQKTHTIWLDFTPTPTDPSLLSWVHEPTHVCVTPDWFSSTKVVPHLIPKGDESDPGEAMASAAADGPNNFFAKREVIDEYGWRNFGDIFADHEGELYTGPKPVISHYNNQYDIILGTLQQYWRTGNSRWAELAGPLARHVSDIDIYHTDRDRAAYNGGLFWFTFHYFEAGTGSHRGFTRQYAATVKGYGGGPSSNHSFSTGLLHYYYLTGDPIARDAVLSLANWTIAMDDGGRNILGLIDRGPTGLASLTQHMGYHGPGRGCGNSVNTLMDGWLLTGERKYLDKAEELIRRSVHPLDDVPARDLLNAEMWWSYTVLFTSLSRYLNLKIEANEKDFTYAYARAALIRYAEWMVEHERPVLDRPELLQYLTSAWPAQELRKANVLRLSAEHADEPLRSRLLQRGEELANRAWKDLSGFETRTFARTLALILAEQPRDDFFRRQRADRYSPSDKSWEFGSPTNFVPQRQRVRNLLKSPLGISKAILGLFDPRGWCALFQLPWRSWRP